MMEYTVDQIRQAYENVGVTKGSTVMLRTDLRFLGRLKGGGKKEDVRAHFEVLSGIVDLSQGTIVVSTSSTYLCNTDVPFDLEKTASERGALTEYIRTRKGAVRSFHSFMSYAAIGKNAHRICGNVSRHSYGPETPKQRLLDLDALYVSIGMHPRFTCTVVHHIEFVMGVPYRYVKEFIHPVVCDKKIVAEPFYLHVLYRECNIRKNRNVKIFDRFFREGYVVREHPLGRGRVYGYSMVDFYKSTVQAFKEDMYIYAEEPPRVRPYQK